MSGIQGKTVLITGATGGIGKETALELAKAGAKVILVGRDKARGNAALADLKTRTGNQQIELMLADMSSLKAIHDLAEEFMHQHDHLDVLINNVGGLYRERWLTVDGIEATLMMNHLNSFLLTHLLLPALKASKASRVINVTGGMANRSLDLDNLQAEKGFRGLETYSHAKVAMMVASYEFARRLQGTGVSLNVAFPGAAATAMSAGMKSDMLPWFMRPAWPIAGIVMKNLPATKAARSSIYLASSPEVEGVSGNYYDTNSKLAKWPKAVYDENVRRRLWEVSEQLTRLAATSTSGTGSR